MANTNSFCVYPLKHDYILTLSRDSKPRQYDENQLNCLTNFSRSPKSQESPKAGCGPSSVLRMRSHLVFGEFFSFREVLNSTKDRTYVRSFSFIYSKLSSSDSSSPLSNSYSTLSWSRYTHKRSTCPSEVSTFRAARMGADCSTPISLR